MIESRPPSVFANSAAPDVHQEESGAERNGTERPSLLPFGSRYQACTRSRSSMVGSSCRAGGVHGKKRELVGLVTRRARERSGSVGVHSPNSASGCDRSYLTRLRSRHAENRQPVRFTRDRVLRDRAIRPIARRLSFLWPDLFPAHRSIPICASNRTTLEYNVENPRSSLPEWPVLSLDPPGKRYRPHPAFPVFLSWSSWKSGRERGLSRGENGIPGYCYGR